MEIQFPIFVLAKDCGEVLKFVSVDEVGTQLEAIDAENNEYEAWDSKGQVLELVPIGLTRWKPGKIDIRTTGRFREQQGR